MKVADLVAAMEQIAPPGGAADWDNVGLLVGNAAAKLRRVILTIDLTRGVLREATGAKCDAVIAYHPPIFKPISRVRGGDVIFDAIRAGLAIYSPHTALDAATGGTCDMLGDVLGLTNRRPIGGKVEDADELKLVTFVPADAADRVASALFEAGAGRIGDYRSCSFRSAGTGTFFGEAGTKPSVGSAGKLERVEEIRLETVVPGNAVAAVVAALRASHPYEEPAFDLVRLAAKPSGCGGGLVGDLAAVEIGELLRKIKRELGLNHVLIAGPTAGKIARAACCPGSCGELLYAAMAAGARLYLTGEVRHHDALAAAEAGMTVVCTLHSNSERAVLGRVAERLGKLMPGLAVSISKSDRDPFAFG